MKTKFNFQKTQYGEVELDIDPVSFPSTIKKAIKEADELGLVKWEGVSQFEVTNTSMGVYAAKCTENDTGDFYEFVVLAESRENAVELLKDYMAGVTPESYTINLALADQKDIMGYINESDNLNFESIFEVSSYTVDQHDEYEMG